MLDFSKMSETELRFIHTYVRALKRDYDLLATVMHVAHPENLDVRDITQATKLAATLSKMHQKFERTLFSLPSVKPLPKYRTSVGPTIEQLASIFALSFFKLLKVDKAGGKSQPPKDAGWFSGKPAEWQAALLTLKDILGDKPPKKTVPDELLTACMKMLSHFFGGLEFPLLAETQYPKNPPKKVWPVAEAALDWDAEIDDDEDNTSMDDVMSWWFN